VKKWLKAGVMEDGKRIQTEEGTPQGSSVSPILANLYLHHVFDFLGFTHICGKNRNGKFAVLRQTMKTRLRAKLEAVKTELRKRLHDPVPDVGRWLASVVRGHALYYGVPTSSRSICLFRHGVIGLWYRSLRRRSHKTRLTWKRMYRLSHRWIPYARITHPYPDKRLCV
jgi:hypothetical protein